MKVLISADMEGVTGVVSSNHTDSTHAEYQRFRKLMTGDVNAAIEGALAGGASEVIVSDAHANMDNILIEDLHPDARLISGSPKPFSMMQGIGPDVDKVFLIGYHAMAGSAPAVLDHTWSTKLMGLTLNGRTVGEIGLNAALAGHFGVAVVLVTGDQHTTAEAHEFLGDIELATVKTALGRTAADCLPPARTSALIREAAARAMSCQVAPFVVQAPITLGIAFMRSTQAEKAELIPGVRRCDPRRVEWCGPDMPTAYRTWRAITALGTWD